MCNINQDCELMLSKYEHLFNAGYLRESFAQLMVMEDRLSCNEMTLDTRIRFYLLFGTVALKLSLLKIA